MQTGMRSSELGSGLSEGRVPALKKSRWLVLRRVHNLTDDQRFRSATCFATNLKTVRAYHLKGSLSATCDYNSPAWAGKFLDDSNPLEAGQMFRRGSAA
jgi:transposase